MRAPGPHIVFGSILVEGPGIFVPVSAASLGHVLKAFERLADVIAQQGGLPQGHFDLESVTIRVIGVEGEHTRLVANWRPADGAEDLGEPHRRQESSDHSVPPSEGQSDAGSAAPTRMVLDDGVAAAVRAIVVDELRRARLRGAFR